MLAKEATDESGVEVISATGRETDIEIECAAAIEILDGFGPPATASGQEYRADDRGKAATIHDHDIPPVPFAVIEDLGGSLVIPTRKIHSARRYARGFRLQNL